MQHYSNYSLKNYNTFHIEAFAKDFFVFDCVNELSKWLSANPYDENNTLVIGGGSNLLFAEDFPGTIIYPHFKGFEILKSDRDDVLVKIAAGEIWDSCVEKAVNEGLGGIENLSLIPGHAGAVPVQNIGAYGVEIQDVLEYVEGFWLEGGKPFRMSRQDCRFDYRYSVFKGPLKNKIVITHVVLRLSRKPVFKLDYGALKSAVQILGEVNPENIRKAIVSIREAKLPDPDVLGNAGSFFKNPVVTGACYDDLRKQWPEIPGYPVVDNEMVKIPAGWLIEKAGWKGRTRGNAGVHKHQALVLINRNGASGKEILELALAIETDILKKFDIHLNREVNVIPNL